MNKGKIIPIRRGPPFIDVQDSCHHFVQMMPRTGSPRVQLLGKNGYTKLFRHNA
jgi:hypothetical protein